MRFKTLLCLGLALALGHLISCNQNSYAVYDLTFAVDSVNSEGSSEFPEESTGFAYRSKDKSSKQDTKSKLKKLHPKHSSGLKPPEEIPMLAKIKRLAFDGPPKCFTGDKSLHPEKDRDSDAYSRRRAPGPDHGSDPKDENHLYGQTGYPKEDPYNGTTSNGSDPYGGAVPNGRKPY